MDDIDTGDEKRLSPDSMIGPMIANQKKDKLCLVCGDKALGYNFNAISCESCKAFFRRNAHKTIRGRCEGRCDINTESRSFCKRCRLAKCFAVGMRKDMILDESQKKLRKQKILINKLRRHGTMLPEDSYAITEQDIKINYSTPSCVENIREQYPHLKEDEIRTLCGVDVKPTINAKGKADIRDKLKEYMPWSDLKDSLSELVQDMEPHHKSVLLEMNKAHESSAFLSNTSTRLKSLPNNPTEVFNIADGFVRRIIKVAKQLEYFRVLEKDDQIALLKGSVVEIMMLRSAVNFDVKTETWNLSTVNCIKNPGDESSTSENQSTDSKMHPQGLDIEELRKAAMNGADFNTLRNMAHQGNAPSNVNAPPNVNELRKAAMNGADINKLRNMANSGIPGEQMSGTKFNGQADTQSREQKDLAGLEGLRNAAKAAGFDVDALRQAAMNGASFSQLSQMAHSGSGNTNATDIKQENNDKPSTSNTISSAILKQGNTETKTLFLTYSKFIRSLMSTIFGDLVVLKFLIMLSLFSSDRQGLINRDVVDKYQEIYANSLRKYIEIRFPTSKNMFARCIMKLTDLRNVNEVHTKMLLKMQVTDIEPLLVEIFDLPS